MHTLDKSFKNEAMFTTPAHHKMHMFRYCYELEAAKLIRSKERAGFLFSFFGGAGGCTMQLADPVSLTRD